MLLWRASNAWALPIQCWGGLFYWAVGVLHVAVVSFIVFQVVLFMPMVLPLFVVWEVFTFGVSKRDYQEMKRT